MNQEIAGKLLALRKQNGYSQEELAEKLGISRQAVSKWERGDASPDTDNLISLARIYNISLDRLFDLNTEESSTRGPVTLKKKPDDGERVMYPKGSLGTEIYPNTNDIKTDAVESEDLKEYFRYEAPEENAVQVRNNSSDNYKNPEPEPETENVKLSKVSFPYSLLATIIFFLLGAINLWHPGWMIFLTIPLYYTGKLAVKKKNYNIFCYPVLVTFVYLLIGFALNFWHPGWILYLTIPVYYWFVNTVYRGKLSKGGKN